MCLSEKSDIVMQALHDLGYRKIRSLRIDNIFSEISNVYVNDEYFGIYDFTRRTFID